MNTFFFYILLKIMCTLHIINHKVGNIITVKGIHVVYQQYDA